MRLFWLFAVVASCVPLSPTSVPTTFGTTPGIALAEAGPLSCVRVYTADGTPVHPSKATPALKPTSLIIQGGGALRSEACRDWVSEQLPTQPEPSTQEATSQPAVIEETQAPKEIPAFFIQAFLGNQRRIDLVRNDFDTITAQSPFTMSKLLSEEGWQLSIQNEELKGETRGYLYLQAETGNYNDDPKRVFAKNTRQLQRVPLHIIDTEFLNSLSWRQSAVLMSGTFSSAIGAAVGGLWYPLRLSPSVTGWFLRELAVEFDVGSASDSVNNSNIKTQFFFAGAALTWRELLSVGVAYDLSNQQFKGLYTSVTLFSRRGVFGFIPYQDILDAVQNAARQRNRTPEPESGN